MTGDSDPVTVWLCELREGDPDAASKLWDYFCHRLKAIARHKLSTNTRAAYDEEDAVQSAFFSFVDGVNKGSFPDLKDRNELWRLLLVMTSRKVAHRHRHELQDCRDVRRVMQNLVFGEFAFSSTENREPTPEFVVEFSDTYESLLKALNSEELMQIATLKLEGYSDAEVAARIDCSRRTVQRRLEIIRRIWEKSLKGQKES